ncbi:MAG: glucose-1-phosphate thymidylyltransferase [Candidatus Krumholzibacteria bacterium]|nr:glucose-1-phosphate thymidylyltransferase [Candidatus Krumholzibacteria bacterium]
MKALILSGGKGTRLRPITHTSAKQLVPVANKPILFYGLEAIRDAGITDVGIVVGDTADEVRRAVGDGGQFGLKVDYIPQEAPLGLAHAVKISRDFLEDSPFVMYLGDNLLSGGITDFVEDFIKGNYDSQILLARVKNPREFGVAELDGERVVGLEEKPKKPKSDYALVGVYMFTSSIFEATGKIKPSFRGELEITDAIQYLIDNDFVVNSHVVEGWWKDTGKLEDMLDANRMILTGMTTRVESKQLEDSEIHGHVQLDEGVVVRNSVMRGPCIVGAGSEIVDSYIGPFTSIGPNTRIMRSEIENSIVLENCTISDIGSRIGGSLLGKNVKVSKSEKPPRNYSFMVGDNSEIIVL